MAGGKNVLKENKLAIDRRKIRNYDPAMALFNRYRLLFACVSLILIPQILQSQSPWSGTKLVGIVPITGKGTWEDPRRPDLPKELSGNYQWLPSDDGKWAIVEIGEGTGSEAFVQAVSRLSKEGASAGVRLFRPGIHSKAQVEAEIRRLRSSFTLETFAGPVAAAARRP